MEFNTEDQVYLHFKGKLDQVKNLGCKSAVCSQGQGGKTFWKECQQPATEEKQLKMIEIQNETKEKADQINNKQTRVIESLNKMNERQDKMIENQNVIISLLGRICKTNSKIGDRVK